MGTFDERKEALVYADELAELARRAPSREIKAKVMIIANNVRVIYGMTDQEKLETVFLLIAEGAATVDDLVAETGFPRPTLSGLITQLKDMHRVRISTISSGHPGPPRLLIVPRNGSYP